jgi:hypothetical protein
MPFLREEQEEMERDKQERIEMDKVQREFEEDQIDCDEDYLQSVRLVFDSCLIAFKEGRE